MSPLHDALHEKQALHSLCGACSLLSFLALAANGAIGVLSGNANLSQQVSVHSFRLDLRSHF
jgi:hypothetical protein